MAFSPSELLARLLQELGRMTDVEIRMVRTNDSTPQSPELGSAILIIRDAVTLELEPVVRRLVFPRDARGLLWKWQDKIKNPEARLPFLVAEAISPGAKEILREAGVGYFDSGGSLFLGAAEVYLFVDKPLPPPMGRAERSLFTPRREQVLLVLLMHPRLWFSVHQLARIAQVSPATVSQTLLELDRYEWMETSGKGPAKQRRLIAPEGLLDAWARHVAVVGKISGRRINMPFEDAREGMQRIARACTVRSLRYAITHVAAAQLLLGDPPTVNCIYCYLQQSQDIAALLTDLGADVVDGNGGNIVILERTPNLPVLFSEQIDNINLACPIRVYLDLVLTSECRLAGTFRRTRLGF